VIEAVKAGGQTCRRDQANSVRRAWVAEGEHRRAIRPSWADNSRDIQPRETTKADLLDSFAIVAFSHWLTNFLH
jgi:hypothetical protein